MKANEFRIGNWVKYRIYDEMDTPKEYDAYSKIEAEDLLHLQQNPEDADYKPIPITPEILEKCGFKKFESGNFYHPKTMFELTPKFWLEGSERAVKAGYLHQLQNLYFALTGEELEVKLENIKPSEPDKQAKANIFKRKLKNAKGQILVPGKIATGRLVDEGRYREIEHEFLHKHNRRPSDIEMYEECLRHEKGWLTKSILLKVPEMIQLRAETKAPCEVAIYAELDVPMPNNLLKTT